MLSDNWRLLGQKLIESHPWYLAPLSWIYAALVFLRNLLYDWKLLPITKVSATVVSVGNIVAGGTGKTPFVQMLAKAFPSRRVAILSRGYGLIADEAMLLAKDFPVFVGKNRAKLAKKIEKEFDLIILDDGFQHRKLFRDFDIVLTRTKKERYLPFGFLRDSPRRLAKAIVFQEEELELKIKRILDLEGKEIPSIEGKEVILFCAIANPHRFRKTLEQLGAKIVHQKIFADHAKIDLSHLPKGPLLVCTEKDAVKLQKTELPIVYLQMQMQIRQNLKKWEKLVEKIDQKIDNRPHEQ